jgi:ABC-type uncharacterized transport system fused permease/ATPase subunit
MAKFIAIENHILNKDKISSISQIENNSDDLEVEGLSVYIPEKKEFVTRLRIIMENGEEFFITTRSSFANIRANLAK